MPATTPQGRGLFFNQAWLYFPALLWKITESWVGVRHRVKSGLLLSFLTVTNDIFGAADASDCAFLIPVDTADECCKWQRPRLFFFVLKMPRKLGWCHKHWYLTFPAVSVLDHLLLLQARHCSIGVSLWGAFCSMWNLHFPTCVDHSDYIQLSKTAATTLWPWLPWQ